MAAATTYTLTGPGTATGAVGEASGNFTITPDGDTTDVVTPQDTNPDGSDAGGTFTPATITLANTTPKTFTYTPATTNGTVMIATTNDGDLEDPEPVFYQGQTPVTWPTEYGNADMSIEPATPKIIVDGEAEAVE